MPTIALTPNPCTPSSPFSVLGAGFAPGQRLRVEAITASGKVGATYVLRAGADGRFECGFLAASFAESQPINVVADAAPTVLLASATMKIQAATPPPPPPPPSVVISSSIAQGATISGSLVWQATVDGETPSEVDMQVDAQPAWVEKISPYQYNGDPDGRLDTTQLANGAHTLTITSKPSGAVLTVPVTVANVVAPPPPIVLPFPGFAQAYAQAAPGTTIEIPPGSGAAYQPTARLVSTKPGLVWKATGAGVVIDLSKCPMGQQQGFLELAAASQQVVGFRMTGAAVRAMSVSAPDCSATDMEVDHAGDLGVGVTSGADRFHWSGGKIHECNPLWTPANAGSAHSGGNVGPFNPGWEAGGMKIIPGLTGVVVDGLEVYGNAGPGVWSDTNHGPASGIVIRNLRGHDQPFPAIMVEASDGVDIIDPVVWECGWWLQMPGFDFWAGGILVSSCGHVTIENPLVAWCPSGIVEVSQDDAGHGNPGQPRDGLPVVGNTVSGGLFAESAGRQQVRVSVDWPSPYPAPVVTGSAIATAAQLTAAGVPTAPQPGH